MSVSKTQIQRIKNLILNRLNDNCQLETAATTTTTFNGQVNRPIQKNTNTEAWCCTSSDWKFRNDKDPVYWLDSWDNDYHGWENVDAKFKTQSP